MRIDQRYASAVNSKTLINDELHLDCDTLAAVALSSKLGSMLYRLRYAGDNAALLDLLPIWRTMVRKHATKLKYEIHAEDVADTSLAYWLNEICRECHGRGHPVIIKTPTLADATCPACSGSGKRPLICDGSIRAFVRDGVAWLNRLAGEAAASAKNKLG